MLLLPAQNGEGSLSCPPRCTAAITVTGWRSIGRTAHVTADGWKELCWLKIGIAIRQDQWSLFHEWQKLYFVLIKQPELFTTTEFYSWLRNKTVYIYHRTSEQGLWRVSLFNVPRFIFIKARSAFCHINSPSTLQQRLTAKIYLCPNSSCYLLVSQRGSPGSFPLLSLQD